MCFRSPQPGLVTLVAGPIVRDQITASPPRPTLFLALLAGGGVMRSCALLPDVPRILRVIVLPRVQALNEALLENRVHPQLLGVVLEDAPRQQIWASASVD